MNVYAFIIAGVASMFYPQNFTPAIHVDTLYVCAMNVEPAGTFVEVENSDNGLSSHCVVTGTGPCCGRVLDASPKVAEELGYGDSLAHVRVYKVVKRLRHCKRIPEAETCKTPPDYCVLDLPKPAIEVCF